MLRGDCAQGDGKKHRHCTLAVHNSRLLSGVCAGCALYVALQRGDTAKAKWQYEKILGKALLGRGPAEHWAHSEYAWIAFNDGDLQVRAWTPQKRAFHLENPHRELNYTSHAENCSW
jgi:hypothetical protein